MGKFNIVETMDVEGVPRAIHFSNCLDGLDAIISSAESKEWKPDVFQDGEALGSFTFLADPDEGYSEIHKAMMEAAEKFLSKTDRNISDYTQKFEYYKIVRWENPSKFMDEHEDRWEIDGESVIPDISLVMYLTEDFDGANVTFSKFDKMIKPLAGDIIAFNSNTLHGVSPYKGGRRITTQLFLFKK